MWEKLKAKLMMAVEWVKLRWMELKTWVLGLFSKKDDGDDTTK